MAGVSQVRGEGEGIPDEGLEGRDGERWERPSLSHSYLLLQSPAPLGIRTTEAQEAGLVGGTGIQAPSLPSFLTPPKSTGSANGL